MKFDYINPTFDKVWQKFFAKCPLESMQPARDDVTIIAYKTLKASLKNIFFLKFCELNSRLSKMG